MQIENLKKRGGMIVQDAFELVSKYSPQGDQPEAIRQLLMELIVGNDIKPCSGQLERVRLLRFQM